MNPECLDLFNKMSDLTDKYQDAPWEHIIVCKTGITIIEDQHQMNWCREEKRCFLRDCSNCD